MWYIDWINLRLREQGHLGSAKTEMVWVGVSQVWLELFFFKSTYSFLNNLLFLIIFVRKYDVLLKNR